MGLAKEIKDGYLNLLKLKLKIGKVDAEIREMAEKRYGICLQCVDNYNITKITNLNTCRICGCYLPAKVISPTSSCPEDKW